MVTLRKILSRTCDAAYYLWRVILSLVNGFLNLETGFKWGMVVTASAFVALMYTPLDVVFKILMVSFVITYVIMAAGSCIAAISVTKVTSTAMKGANIRREQLELEYRRTVPARA